MRKFLPVILMLSLLAILTTSASAVGKITVDPNAPGAKKASEETPETDSRLAQKVTYEAKRKPVREILSDLEAMTQVTFKAGVNQKDWQVRDRKMSIFVKDVPLSDLMNSIARVMKFKWERGGTEEARTYRLYMDRKSLLDAESQRLREEERIDKEMKDKREKMFADYDKADKLSPQEMEKLKGENPFLYVAAQSGLVGSLGKFFREAPSAIEALASGQEMTLSAGNLSPMAQQGLLQSITSLSQIQARISRGRGGELPDGLAANIGQVTVELNPHLEAMNSMPINGIMLGEMNMRYGDKHFVLPFINPESNLAKMIGKAMIKSEEEDRPIDDILKESQGGLISLMSDMKKDDSGEPVVEHPEDPALSEKVKLKPPTEKNRLSEIQAALAEASKYAIISDSYGGGQGFVNVTDQEKELKAILEEISNGYHYNWEKRGSVIEFRDRNWFKKRAAQIPDAWLDAWRETLKSTGTLDIADLVQIAALTMEQFNTNVMGDEDLMRNGMAGIIFGNRELLRAYGALTESQQSMLFSEGGLSLRSLSPSQWPQVEKLIKQRNVSYLQSEESDIKLSATRTQRDKQFEYSFTLSTTDALEPVKWSFTTPKYTEPPKKQ